MDFLGAIGNAIGSLFGANQKKKKDQTQVTQPTRTVTAPTTVLNPSVNPASPTVAQNTVRVPQPFALPVAPNLGGTVQPTQAPAQPKPTVALPDNPFPISTQDISNQFQAQRQAEFNRAATPIMPNAFLTHEANAAKSSILDTLNLANSNPVSHAVLSIPQGVAKGVIQGINQLGGNVATNVTDPVMRGILNTPSGNLGNSTTEGEQASRQIDAMFGDSKGTGLSSAPKPVQTAIGGAYDVLSALPGAGLLKPVRSGVSDLLGIGKGVKAADAAVIDAGAEAAPSAVVNNVAEEAPTIVRTEPIAAPAEPSSLITSTPATNKPQAITSPNRVQAPTPTPTINVPEPITQPVVAAPVRRDIPQYVSPIRNNKTASVAGANSAKYTTGDENLDNIVHDSIVAHKGVAKTADARTSSLDDAGITADQRSAIRNIAVNGADKSTGQISNEGVQQIKDVLTGKTAGSVSTPAAAARKEAAQVIAENPINPQAVKTAELGTITRNAVKDGSIKTPEGIDKVVSDTTTAANTEASKVGDTLDNIIKKGQKAYDDSQAAGHDLSTSEVIKNQPDFTAEQQSVYKKYSQELTTLRDRSGHSLKGGNQGEWYAPRQFLNDGKSAEYDSSLINELKRTGVKTDSEGNRLDYSATPFEHYIRRYSDAGNAATQRMVNAVEADETGAATGIKVPQTAKDELNKSMAAIADKRDQIDQLVESGDRAGANKLHSEVQSDTNKAFNKFADNIPKDSAGRQEAVNRVKAMRDTYETTLAQTLTTSNLVNRVADQGTKVVEAVKRPLVQGLKKVVGGKYKTIAKANGTDAFGLNTSRAATKAASQVSRGTLGREIVDNLKANVSLAGAGRNPIVKGIAKIDASVRGAGGSLLQFGDLSTPNVREALQIGASRPEAQSLKTVADFKSYFNDYTKTSKFREDLATVQESQNPKIGLAGGETQRTGKVSNFLSKEVDNALATNANRIKPGFGKNRVVREANDFIKGNVTGYAGVGSRVLGTVRDAAVPIAPLRRAAAQAASGDPAAVARATTTAAHAIADSIALYGAGGAAAALAGTGVIGYTGSQPTLGSSASAYNKQHTIPANQFFLNLPNGKRVYFDPARPAGAAGVGADIAASVVKGGGNVASTLENVGNQIYNQAGGSSLPENAMNAYTGFLDPSATESDKKYAQSQIQALAAPSTGVLNNIANIQDPTKRAPTNFFDDLKANLPGLRPQVPAAKNADGTAIANSKQLSGGSSLFSVGDNPDGSTTSKSTVDPVADEVTRLHKLGIDITPTSGNTNASNDSAKDISKTLVNDPIYQKSDDKTKAKFLKGVLDGNTGKDIDPSLNDDDKRALLDGSLLGKKKAAWLDDNSNNAAYQTATYNNAKASGTLTDKDDDLTNASGLHYKAVLAQVDKDYKTNQGLRDDYKGTSQSELAAYLNPKSPEYDLAKAQKVYDYDQARVKAGLPAKYNLDKAQKTGAYASKGSSSSKNFAFASLPSSLVGNTSSSSSGSSKYAEATRLFTPIADLKTPSVAAIPKGRTISVSKGVTV